MPDHLPEDIRRQQSENSGRLVPTEGEVGYFLAVTGLSPFAYAFRQGPDDEVPRFPGSPDGVLSAPIDSLVRNTDDHSLYINTDGDAAWELVGSGAPGSFPITYDDGSYTYTIRIFGGNIINQVTDNGAGDALLSQSFLGSDGLVELDDYTGGGIFLRCTDGGGGIHLVDTSDGGIFLQADNAGGVVVNSNDGGFIGLNAEGGIFLSDSSGVVVLNNLPTSDPLDTGRLWNDSGTVKISL